MSKALDLINSKMWADDGLHLRMDDVATAAGEDAATIATLTAEIESEREFNGFVNAKPFDDGWIEKFVQTFVPDLPDVRQIATTNLTILVAKANGQLRKELADAEISHQQSEERGDVDNLATIATLTAERDKLKAAQTRMFPIQRGPSVPWEVMAPHDDQCKRNHGGQTLERIAQRGGLSSCEAWYVVNGLRYDDHGAIAARYKWLEYAERINLHYNELDQLRKELADAEIAHQQSEERDDADNLATQEHIRKLIRELAEAKSAISRIDYAFQPPNKMEVSLYDADGDQGRVVRMVCEKAVELAQAKVAVRG